MRFAAEIQSTTKPSPENLVAMVSHFSLPLLLAATIALR